MAPPKTSTETDTVTALQAQVSELAGQLKQLLEARPASMASAVLGAPLAVRKPIMGKQTFRLTEPHYRLGRTYQPGELITIENEVPGRTWELFDPNAPVVAPVVVPPSVSRPSDVTV